MQEICVRQLSSNIEDFLSSDTFSLFYAPPAVFEHDKYNFQRFATSACLAAANNRSHNRHINYLLSQIFTEGRNAIKHIKYNAEILIPLHIGGITYLSSYTERS